MKAQAISQEKKSFRANWKHLTLSSLLWKKKKKIPNWGQFNSVFEIHIHLKMIGRKEGRGEKQRKMGVRKGSKAGTEPRMWTTFDHLGNMPLKSWNPLFFFFSHIIKVWGLIFYQVNSPLKSLWQVPQLINLIKMNGQCLILIFLLSTNKSKDNEKCKPTCIRMFTAGLFIITKNWKQPKCSSGNRLDK